MIIIVQLMNVWQINFIFIQIKQEKTGPMLPFLIVSFIAAMIFIFAPFISLFYFSYTNADPIYGTITFFLLCYIAGKCVAWLLSEVVNGKVIQCQKCRLKDIFLKGISLKIVFIKQTLLKLFLVHESEVCCQQMYPTIFITFIVFIYLLFSIF